ncbi:ABC transporter permease [Alkalicoccobacillus porphyridii]|uniref:Iron ABC transporter permease n=1 Tax=Alkalicoccobacillus porphyridii TaxID=2597270 RepID=A0A553ZYU0_9BACI|nr:iron ABC transporter permease [Alkalicoccobacillus porphyridii]TSB46613.1 iron ABC transporter permease [Alkalicoccobacillus porphyridii]
MLVKKWWLQLWRGNSPGLTLFSISFISALLLSIPVFYVIIRSLSAGGDRWLRLLDERIPDLLLRTLSLTFMVTITTVIIGVLAAWLIERTDLPLKGYWRWLLAIPLVIPPYIGALAYIIVFGPRGFLWRLWRDNEWLAAIMDYPFDIYSFWGVWLILSLFTFPYVFLIVSSSLRKISRSYEEVARSQGISSFAIFFKVYLPFLRPAIGAGALLVSLYVITDFGAIAMLRYLTFTSAIYYNISSYDNVSATVLSTVLFAITLLLLWFHSRFTKSRKYHQSSKGLVMAEDLTLGKWKGIATAFVVFLFTLSVVLPIIVLIYWSYIGFSTGAVDHSFIEYTVNTFQVAGMAALISMIIALPIMYLKSRHPSMMSTAIDRLAYSGYALPGVIVALGIIFFFNQYIPSLYNTVLLVALAFVIRFLPQVLQSGEASLSLVSPKLDEAARSLGLRPWKVVLRVILPSIFPSLLAGGALVFVSSIKELPATLLLRPPGFETIATRIWVETREDVYYLAAPLALLIIVISILPLKYLLKKY